MEIAEMKRKYLVIIIILCVCLIIPQTILAYVRALHPLVTRVAIGKSKLAETDYLKVQLGFKNGLDEVFTGPGLERQESLPIREWIALGSDWEDELVVDGWVRAPRHMYDPIHPPGRLTDITSFHASLSGPYTSALQWAQARPGSNDPYSWADAREYYYKALTSRYETIDGENLESAEHSRNWYFAQTFRALGQVIHLLEDMATPAHVRNDRHIPGDADLYEAYCTPGAPLIYEGYPVVEYAKFS